MMDSETKRPRQAIKRTIQKTYKKLQQRGPKTIQHQNRSKRSNEFHLTNNGNFTKLQGTIKTSLKQGLNPDGCVLNLSKHSFSKDTHKLLNKNLSIYPSLVYTVKTNSMANFKTCTV